MGRDFLEVGGGGGRGFAPSGESCQSHDVCACDRRL